METLSAILASDGPTTADAATETVEAGRNTYYSPFIAHEIAVRTEVTESFSFDQATCTIIATKNVTSYQANITWASDTYDTAMRYNILPVLDRYYTFTSNVDDSVFGSIVSMQDATRISLEESPIFTKWAAKPVKDGKYAGIPQGERLESLLRIIANGIAKIEAGKSRLRTLKSPSPVPHPDTSEQTHGSMHEISKQEIAIGLMEKSLLKTITKLTKVLAILNKRGAEPVISRWLVQLPSDLNAITSRNPQLYEDVLPKETESTVEEGEDEEAENEEQ